MIGHSLGRMETCFGPSAQGAGIRYQNTSQIQILLASHFEKDKGGAMYEFEIDWPDDDKLLDADKLRHGLGPVTELWGPGVYTIHHHGVTKGHVCLFQ